MSSSSVKNHELRSYWYTPELQGAYLPTYAIAIIDRVIRHETEQGFFSDKALEEIANESDVRTTSDVITKLHQKMVSKIVDRFGLDPKIIQDCAKEGETLESLARRNTIEISNRITKRVSEEKIQAVLAIKSPSSYFSMATLSKTAAVIGALALVVFRMSK